MNKFIYLDKINRVCFERNSNESMQIWIFNLKLQNAFKVLKVKCSDTVKEIIVQASFHIERLLRNKNLNTIVEREDFISSDQNEGIAHSVLKTGYFFRSSKNTNISRCKSKLIQKLDPWKRLESYQDNKNSLKLSWLRFVTKIQLHLIFIQNFTVLNWDFFFLFLSWVLK